MAALALEQGGSALRARLGVAVRGGIGSRYVARRATSGGAAGRETASFGFADVDASAKAGLVGEVFRRVADSYDLMNDLMSGGVHRLWKECLVERLNPQPGAQLLDVAGGTGDVAFRFVESVRARLPPPAMVLTGAAPAPPQSRVVVCDINPNMLKVGRQRAQERGYLPPATSDAPPAQPAPDVRVEFVEGDAEQLPFEAKSFDAYTISFGLRNVTRVERALAEAHRVLRDGGVFMCLEFSHVSNPLLAQVYDAYSFNVIPWLGEVVAQDRASYQYLVESIRRFPRQRRLAAMMRRAGFSGVSFENFTGGVVALHVGFKF